MTKQEQQSARAAKKLCDAFLAIETYDGSPDDVLEDARVFLCRKPYSDKIGVRDLINVLDDYYSNKLYCRGER